jgi:hypothetical protein
MVRKARSSIRTKTFPKVKRFALSLHYTCDGDEFLMQLQALIPHDGIDQAAHAPGASRVVPTPNESGCASPRRNKEEERSGSEMRQPTETEFVQVESVVCNSNPWEATTPLAPNRNLGARTLHVRSVELIAQPGKIRELGSCVRGVLMDHLKKQRGFGGVIVLSSLKEPRLILVMSFWKAEKDAESRWESSAAVLKMVSPLIDVCTRVHTYEAAMPTLRDAPLPVAVTPVC